MKTVSFFEVCDEGGDPVAVVDWQAILGSLEVEPPADRGHVFRGAPHHGQVYLWEGSRHLILARHREDAPSTYDMTSGEIVDADTQSGLPWVEFSVISFLPNTNRFGFVLGGQASPRDGALADWINLHEIFDETITIQPVVDRRLLDRLSDASAYARMVSLRLSPDQFAGLGEAGGLWSAANTMREQVPGNGVSVEVTMKIDGQAKSADPSAMRGLVSFAGDILSRDVQRAVVELVDFDEDGKTDRDMLDLLKYRIASKERVSVLDEEGNPVRIPSALRAIRRAADRKGELASGATGGTVVPTA